MPSKEDPTLLLDGYSLTPSELYQLSFGKTNIALTNESRLRVQAGRNVVDKIVESGETVYGINTGFGLFSNVTVGPEQLGELQENLIRSHCSGVGTPLPMARTRMILALRINILSKGHSGISEENIDKMVAAFNADCLSAIPEKGTVGASGDLAPLSHLALGLMGEGLMWNPKTKELDDAAKVLKENDCRPIVLGAKEGLALINGTQFIASLGSEAVTRAANVARIADVATALTLEVLCGTVRAYHPLIHKVRPHAGQMLVASRIRKLLSPSNPSELFNSHQYKGKVQDAYSLRCAPQVHGICNDTVDFVSKILTTELNSATDNPMVFTNEQINAEVPFGFDMKIPENENDLSTKLEVEARITSPMKAASPSAEISDLEAAKKEIAMLRKAVAEKRDYGFFKKNSDLQSVNGNGAIMSGGNFHGEYPAKALDYLAIGISELAAISERRIERLCNPSLSGLPAFLVKEGGLNSGFMIAHCTAAALVSENKVLTHPSSVDSLSTSAAKEDHVSMGGFAARKAVEVVDHVETVIAIEILASCQALDLHRPLRSTAPLEAVYDLVRSKAKPWDKDRMMSPNIDAVKEMVKSGAIWECVKEFYESAEE